MRPRRNTPEDIIGRLDATGICWEWPGALNSKGYGQARLDMDVVYVHRLAYEHLVGPIPDGLQLDHLCRNRRCANPDHLEPVTNRENARRGHPGKYLRRQG